MVKARPDIRIRTHGRTLASLGMEQRQPRLAAPWHRYFWKDKTAGDAVMYLWVVTPNTHLHVRHMADFVLCMPQAAVVA